MPNKTIIQVPVTITELQGFSFAIMVVDAVASFTCSSNYVVKDDVGTPSHPRLLPIPLNASQENQILNFINNAVLPTINTHEGTA